MNFVTDKQQKYFPVLIELNLLVAIDRQLRCEAKYSCVKDKKFLNLISSLIYGKFCPRRKVTVYEDRWLCHEFEILCENTEINIGGSTYGGLPGSRNQGCSKPYEMKASKGNVLVLCPIKVRVFHQNESCLSCPHPPLSYEGRREQNRQLSF